MKDTNYIVYIVSETGALRSMFDSTNRKQAEQIYEDLKGNFRHNKYVLHAELRG